MKFSVGVAIALIVAFIIVAVVVSALWGNFQAYLARRRYARAVLDTPGWSLNHTAFECVQPCEKQHCHFCEGGLLYCTVCGGAESSAPTHCPGVRMAEEVQEYVTAEMIDFKNGQWITHPKWKPTPFVFPDHAIIPPAVSFGPCKTEKHGGGKYE